MVYYDLIGHMVADSEEELHTFAKRLGLRREWYQEKGIKSHYDLTTQHMKDKAGKMGAKLIRPRELLMITRKRMEAKA